jgi:hypothetical protein
LPGSRRLSVAEEVTLIPLDPLALGMDHAAEQREAERRTGLCLDGARIEVTAPPAE